MKAPLSKKSSGMPELNLDKPVIKTDYLAPSKVKASAKEAAMKWRAQTKFTSLSDIPKTYIKTTSSMQRHHSSMYLASYNKESTMPPVLKAESDRLTKTEKLGSRVSLPVYDGNKMDNNNMFASKFYSNKKLSFLTTLTCV